MDLSKLLADDDSFESAFTSAKKTEDKFIVKKPADLSKLIADDDDFSSAFTSSAKRSGDKSTA